MLRPGMRGQFLTTARQVDVRNSLNQVVTTLEPGDVVESFIVLEDMTALVHRVPVNPSHMCELGRAPVYSPTGRPFFAMAGPQTPTYALGSPYTPFGGVVAARTPPSGPGTPT